MILRRVSFWFAQLSCAAAVVGGANARAEEAPGLTWMVTDPPAAGFFGADRSGFWTSGGKHYRSDGKLDLSVNLSAESGTPEFVASGEAGPVFLGSLAGRSGTPQASTAGAVVTAFDPKGHEQWRRIIGGPASKGSIAVLDGLAVASNGDVIVGGQFSGCLRLAEKGETFCVDEKAARRAETCDVHGETCTEPFVASYDSKGELKSVFAAAGYPTQWFAAAGDGRIALAGAFMGKVALDPGQRAKTLVAEPESPKGHHYQTFWSTFGAGDHRWLGGYALLSQIQSAPRGVAFDSEGSLIVLATVDPLGRQGVPLTLSDGAATVKVQQIEETTALVAVQKASARPALTLLPASTKTARASLSDIRVFASPGGGVFAYGALAAPADAAFIETPFRGHQELTLIGLDGGLKGCAIRVPEGTFTPKAVLTSGGRSCVAFSVFGQHSFKTGGGAVTIGEPRTVSSAIGCLQSPCGRKGVR